jgi:hypothetical protein
MTLPGRQRQTLPPVPDPVSAQPPVECLSGRWVTPHPLHGDGLPPPAQIKVVAKESGDAYTVVAEIPAVPKEDIQMAVDGNVVSLHAEIRQQTAPARMKKRRAANVITVPCRAASSWQLTLTRPRPRPSTTTGC